MLNLAHRVQQIKPSATLAISARTNELIASGKDIINLSVGEPDFDTPEHIKQAAVKALAEGFTKYTPIDGIPALKKAIAAKFAKENNLNYETHEIMVSCGAKQVLYNLTQVLLEKGTEAIVPVPYWVSYPEMVKLAEAEPVFIHTKFEDRYKITPAQLSAAINENTRLLILNSPSNPTGICYSAEELKALADVLLEHPNIVLVADDIYEHIIWDKSKYHNILNICPELKDRTLIVNGVSKAYAMTGWRIGYAAGPKILIDAMKKIQSQSTSNPCSIAQRAAVEALSGDQSSIAEMVKAYKERHDFVHQSLNQLPGVRCPAADGTFYVFPDISECMKKLGINNDIDFAEKLLLEANVAVVPGTEFGAPGHMRVSYATSMDQLKTAMERIKAAL